MACVWITVRHTGVMVPRDFQFGKPLGYRRTGDVHVFTAKRLHSTVLVRQGLHKFVGPSRGFPAPGLDGVTRAIKALFRQPQINVLSTSLWVDVLPKS